MGFETLDAKLSSALSKILNGEFARKVTVMKHQAMDTGRRLSGRQLLRAIDQHFKMTEADGAVYGMEHLLSVSMKNDNLERFLADWDTVLTGMRKRPEDQILEAIFIRQLKQCSVMKDDLRDYDRLVLDDPMKTYAELYRTANRVIERRRLQTHRDAMARHIAGGHVAVATRTGKAARKGLPKGSGKGKAEGGQARPDDPLKGVCRFRLKGKCKAGDSCPLRHNRPCRYISTPEGCRLGDACPFPHTKQTTSHQARRRSPSRPPQDRAAQHPAGAQNPTQSHQNTGKGKGGGKGKKGKGKGKGNQPTAAPAAPVATTVAASAGSQVFRKRGPKGSAVPAEPSAAAAEPARAPPAALATRWIIDSGSAFDIVSEASLTDAEWKRVKPLMPPTPLRTANGHVDADKSFPVRLNQ